MNYLILLTSLLVTLCGCSTSTLSLTPRDLDGEVVTEVSGDITDASVQKELIFAKMRTTRDRMYAKMYQQSGFSVEFELVEVAPGVKIQTMKKVQFKEAPRFDQPLPNGPSVHPVWGAVSQGLSLGETAIKWFVGGDVIKNVWQRSAPQYYGPYNPQTAAPYIVKPEVVYPVIVK